MLRQYSTFFVSMVIISSCVQEDMIPVYMEETSPSIVLEFSSETKASALTSLEGKTLRWMATTSSGGVESAKYNQMATVQSGKIETGVYQTSPATSYKWYATNAGSVSVTGAGPVITTNNASDIVSGAAGPTTTNTPSITLGHVFARTGTLTVTSSKGYVVSDVSWTIKSSGSSSVSHGGTAGTYNMASGAWTGVTTYLTTATPLTASSDMYLIPANYSVTVNYTLTLGDFSSSLSKTGTVALVGGQVNNITATITDDVAIPIQFTTTLTPWDAADVPLAGFGLSTDLSKYDFVTKAKTSVQNTANCYVVRKTGKYKFPLVYGNAIKNGTANTSAYPTGFVDHADRQIASPYITTQTGIAEGSLIAEVLWQEVANSISDLSVSNGYINFTCNFLESNAVIAVKSAGTILWSWHIWATGLDLQEVVITDAYAVEHTILNYNVGQTATSTGKSMLYQWGRKDPFRYDGIVNTIEGGKTRGYSIQNVTTFITKNTSLYDWCSTIYYNSWDADNTELVLDSPVVKTIYDPSPVGYSVPRLNTFTYFSTTNVVGSWSSGYTFKRNSSDMQGVFFPASGYIHYKTAVVEESGSAGRYWLSVHNSDDGAYYMVFALNSVYPHTTRARSYGYNIRPAKEENGGVAILVRLLTLTATNTLILVCLQACCGRSKTLERQARLMRVCISNGVQLQVTLQEVAIISRVAIILNPVYLQTLLSLRTERERIWPAIGECQRKQSLMNLIITAHRLGPLSVE